MRNFFLVLLTFITFSLSGQNLDLTYEEAIKIGLEQNVDLQIQQNDMKLVKAERNQSRGELAPSISASMDGFISSGNTFIQEEARTINLKSENLTGRINANLNVFSGFSQINMIKLRNANYNAQNYLINRTSQDVIFTVTNQYLDVLLALELLEIAEGNLHNQEVLYMQIEAQVEAGNKPRSDLYDQLAIVKNRELLVLQAKNSLSNNKSNLAITLQLDPTVDMRISNPGWDINEILLSKKNVEDLYELALANRPDIKQFESYEEVADRAVSIAKAAFAPRLYAYYGFGSAYNNLNDRSFNEQITVDKKGSQYGLSLSIPIYSGLRNKTQLVSYRVDLGNSKIRTKNLKKTILNEVRNAHQNFMDVKSAYEVSIAQMEAADMALKVQQEKYNLGVGSLIELTNANNNHVSAAARQAQAKLNLLFQKVILDYYTGALDTSY